MNSAPREKVRVQPEQAGNRITHCFDRLRAQGRKALIPFITAGDPSPEVTVPLLRAMVSAGADIIELGVPFSDPMADGPVIQRASERALKHHMSLRHTLDLVREFRINDNVTPIVLMGYLNPIEVMGYDTFAHAAREAGVDGALTVDMPPEEAQDLIHALRAQGIAPIFLLAPTSTPERIVKISALAQGYLYYVSLKGVTGAATLDVEDVGRKLIDIRAITSLPLGVGFGIKDAASAASIAELADAVIVGSALVQKIEALIAQPGQILSEIPALLKEMRAAMDKATSDAQGRALAKDPASVVGGRMPGATGAATP
ncbi:MAG: tryptophan synthase subunit alpha [Gammaproteobacteria bacterium]|nr:tryptophan synthase subunit alpha [Gammaproteobacteria bacterium]